LGAFTALGAMGEEHPLSAAELAGDGKLYLNFWASWCSSCIAELPTLETLSAMDGMRVIGISMDGDGARERAMQLFEGRASYPTYFISEPGEDDGFGGLGAAFDFARLPIPTTAVFSADGVLERVISGPIREEDLPRSAGD